MSATYLRGDCLEVMKSLPDKSVDCFVCDLPYGQLSTGFDRKNHNENIRNKVSKLSRDCCSWDIRIDLNAFWTEVKRLCKSDNTPVLMFCNTKFGIDLINSNPTWFRYDLVWDKGRGVSFLLANKQPMKSHEMIYVFAKKAPYYKRVDVQTDKGRWSAGRTSYSRQYSIQRNIPTVGGETGTRCVLSVIQQKTIVQGGHPTEKPTALYKWLLERYCPTEGTVLDPTAGSFNSVTVAQQLNLHGIGIEKDPAFFMKAVERSVKSSVSEHAEDSSDDEHN